MTNFNWKCPFCGHHSAITDERIQTGSDFFHIDNALGLKELEYHFIVCPNRSCRKFTLTATLKNAARSAGGGWVLGELVAKWSLIPPSKAKVFPDYIPRPILEDYGEACLIVSLSPKASATLARRCLQGILRDFWKVKPGRLVDEIDSVKDKMEPEAWQAIDAVRKVGNIGAHLENDINTIVEVEPEEADLLIGLIETLIEEWYIAREERSKMLKSIQEMAAKKKEARKPSA